MLLRHATVSALLVAGLLPACARTEGYEEYLESWRGQPAAQLVAVWGRPQAQKILGQGKRELTYKRLREITIPGGTTGGFFAAPSLTAQTFRLHCTTTIKVDAEGLVRSWHYEGNGCEA